MGNVLLNLAVSQTARLFANYLDGFGDPARAVSPEQLEAAARERRPLLSEALNQVPAAGLAQVQRMFGSLAGQFVEQPGGHPYMWVLQENCLGRDHAQHVAVIMRHLGWYRWEMDTAVSRLLGSHR